MKILCIGDSNTYGYDPRSYIGSRYPQNARWTGLLHGFDVINCGVNGMTILRGNSVFSEMIRKEEPDLVIVMLGTNDLLSGVSAEETASRMDDFLESVKVIGKDLLLIAPPHLEYGEWVLDGEQVEESLELGDMLRELAERRGCLFADAGEWDIELSYDGVHFSPEGHKVFAQRLEEILLRQTKERTI